MARIIKDLARGYNAGVKPSLAQWVAQQRSTLKLPPAAQTTPLTAEASHRRFYRLRTSGSQSLIVMDSPPKLERNQAFVDLAQVFFEANLPVPQILAKDLDQGFVLMTDVGQRDLFAAYAAGQQEPALAAALSTLVQLQGVRSEHIPAYSAGRLRDELGIFEQWFVASLLTQPLATAPTVAFPTELFEPIAAALVAQADQQPKACVHRDYHCRNLLFSEAGEFGIVDFQDALHGPYTYDLASLLRDCYYLLPEPVVHHWCEWFRVAIAAPVAADEFRRQMDWMAVQRQLKAVGIFVRLNLRDNKPSHLRHIVPTVQQLVRLCAPYPELVPLGDLLQAQLPTLQARLDQQQPPVMTQ
ncbi:MAG: aminoglycoside phosphotransferase family protein [Pseudomonadales bacterium]